MKRVIPLVLAVSLCFSGCFSLPDGNYVSVEPHQEKNTSGQYGTVSAANYGELRNALVQMVDSGLESSVINVTDYGQSFLEQGLAMAVEYTKDVYPVGAYAIEDITVEIGTSGGQPAVSVDISYLHGRSEIRKIKTASDVAAAQEQVAQALENCDSSSVIRVKGYSGWDVTQFVEDYAALHPEIVMEIPEVSVGMYPETGADRILEIKFTYQSSRDALRQMQVQVQSYFASAALYVAANGTEAQKYAQLYAFLMERFDYQLQTSITPAYSLLSYGVGDCEAFATVYAAMCRQSDLECRVITGTKNGEPWSWNLICDNGVYYHVDLLESNAMGTFTKMTMDTMDGYVWDYSAYGQEEPKEINP